MKLVVLDEPRLEFSAGARHVDPRHGIADYGPADATSTAVRTIRAGIVGTPAAIDRGGISLVTTLPAAITLSSPMRTPFITETCMPIQTRSPMMTGALPIGGLGPGRRPSSVR